MAEKVKVEHVHDYTIREIQASFKSPRKEGEAVDAAILSAITQLKSILLGHSCGYDLAILVLTVIDIAEAQGVCLQSELNNCEINKRRRFTEPLL